MVQSLAERRPHAIQRPRTLRPARAIMALALREMATRYGRSPGGYVWAIVEPLGVILILGFGMSLVIRNPPLGTSFLLYYATGLVPFNLYQSLSNVISRSIHFSRALLYIPAITWLDAVLARLLLNTLTGILVGFVALCSIVLVTDMHVSLRFSPILQAIALSILLGFSIGMLNCVLIGLFPTWAVVWSVVTRPLLLASGIFFNFEGLPQQLQTVLWYNPLMHITGLMRTGFYPMYTAQYVNQIYVIFVCLGTLSFGLILMGRFHQKVLRED
nr:ABC transporter permease [uncultured Shimia sp.]